MCPNEIAMEGEEPAGVVNDAGLKLVSGLKIIKESAHGGVELLESGGELH